MTGQGHLLLIADVATFLVSLVLGFGGNVTASSDKSDQKLSLHQLKKADNHDTLNASYANTKALGYIQSTTVCYS
jgi:hypothetical protein